MEISGRIDYDTIEDADWRFVAVYIGLWIAANAVLVLLAVTGKLRKPWQKVKYPGKATSEANMVTQQHIPREVEGPAGQAAQAFAVI